MKSFEQIKQTIETINQKAKMLMCQKDVCFYHYTMILGAIVFFVLGIIVCVCNCDVQTPTAGLPRSCGEMVCVGNCNVQSPKNGDNAWPFVMKMVQIVILFVLLVWWMTFWGKRLDKNMESMKEWNCKVSDCYGRLLDLEINQNKTAKKDDTKTADSSEEVKKEEEIVAKLSQQYEENKRRKELLEEIHHLICNNNNMQKEIKRLEQSLKNEETN